MKGHVPTPDDLCEKMVRRLFRDDPPTSADRILYPGCGDGPFAAAVERVCDANEWERPTGYAVETDPEHLSNARDRGLQHVEFHEQDFLATEMVSEARFNYIVGNPPYVPIEGLNEDEKERYSADFSTAVGRFDLYLLFFERALELLAPGGILSFITPEKYEYVNTAKPLRRLLTSGDFHVEEIEHIDEDSFTGLITFPSITTIRSVDGAGDDDETVIRLRDGSTHATRLPDGGESWASDVRGADIESMKTGVTLGDVTERISCGVATGADTVFVMDREDTPDRVDTKWVYATVSGKQLRAFDGPYSDSVFVCPYRDDGTLADETELGSFFSWLAEHRERLEDRSCVQSGKKWYAWHENPPMQDILQSKILWRDIATEPRFWLEGEGTVVPRHSVYYAVPKAGVPVDALVAYLNSPDARQWMKANCQKAHNGYYRLQSRVLRDLPVPKEWVDRYQATL